MRSFYSSTTSMLINALPLVLIFCTLFITPETCFADFQHSVEGIKNMMTGIVLPAMSTIGLVLAAISFFTGSPNAKQHIVYAIIGCCIGFGSQVIIDFVRNTVR